MTDSVQAMATRYFRQRENPFFIELVRAARSGRPPGEDLSADDAAGALHLVPGVRHDLDRAEVTLIESVLDRGWTWEQLGAEYGNRSKQAMQQHYRRRGGNRSWPAKERPPRTEPPHRLTDEDLDPADVAKVREAISALLATAHDVAETHTVDGTWTAGEPILEEISAVGLDPLPRLEVACRTAAGAIEDMVAAGWERRDPGWTERRRLSWTVRLEDEMRDMASWLDREPQGRLLPRLDRPLAVGTTTTERADHVEIAAGDVAQVQESINLTLARLEAHRAVFDQVIDELKRRQAELP
ncbi:hypothetical protein G3I59_12345 [Amycolatopsis rubida]|uniref:Uncharacterized protein n=1 Tax=Amycolatopsis rubida TaxID=112413 RepID=A0ABX0BLQ4_9PSEU|nr:MULTISPECIES: hypothetical protein [Amycolatopsis]MYW91370.1 hypothetical protein [Amycolatopsis rubida]NEC56355.1 hypothetical protein [Amycolatopsis rubida]OAP28953.1 hypothetical protein A4R44_00746 [Amycolatopsis sp. M39]